MTSSVGADEIIRYESASSGSSIRTTDHPLLSPRFSFEEETADSDSFDLSTASLATSSEDDKLSSSPHQNKPPSILSIFRYADKLDVLLMILGIIFALLQGVSIPLGICLNAPIMNEMMGFQWNYTLRSLHKNFLRNSHRNLSINATAHHRESHDGPVIFETIWPLCCYISLIGACVFITGAIHGTAWTVSGERQIHRIRKKLFKSILKKEMPWFSERRPGELNNVLFDFVRKMEDGMTAKVSVTIAWLCTSVSSFVAAIVIDWQTSLVVMLLAPVMVASSYVLLKIIRSYSAKHLNAYSKAGSIANEAISYWRTVAAFNKQEYEVNRYAEQLQEHKKIGMYRMVMIGMTHGIKHLVTYSMAALTFLLGVQQHNPVQGGTLLVIFMSIVNGSNALGNALPNFNIFATAAAAAEEVFAIIDGPTRSDGQENKGTRIKNLQGEISLNNVTFYYPERPHRKVLRSLSLRIPPGKTVALVGPSGCGKSTIAHLLLRLYDPDYGSIFLDNVDLRDVNIRWLRQHIGYVGQESILFNATVRENIILGGTLTENVTDDKMISAAKMANAHDFIMKLPFGYNTPIGEGGMQLSGGERQRIAIARALISDPRILILDEATSALDAAGESLVQDELEAVRRGRTTIIIAHRLSTMIHADTIAVIDKGAFVELGNHEFLIQNDGLYSRLVANELRLERKPENSSRVVSPDLQPTGVTRYYAKELDGLDMSHLLSTDIEQTVKHKTDLTWFQALKQGLVWNKEEALLIVVCAFVSLIAGAIEPCFQVALAHMLTAFSPRGLDKEGKVMIGLVLALGFVEAAVCILQYLLYAAIGENMTTRMRRRVFSKILRNDASWHDREENRPSVLTTILATDCFDIQGISAIKICSLVSVTVVISISVLYSLILDYRIALAVLPIVPVAVVSGVAYSRAFIGIARDEEQTNKEGATIAMDAISNIRTLVVLGADRFFRNRFNQKYIILRNRKFKGGALVAILQSLMFAAIFWTRAIAFLLGAYLLALHETSTFKIICINLLLGLCGFSIGRHSSATADDDRARHGARNILRILQHVNKIDIDDPDDGESLMAKELATRRLLNKQCAGKIEFQSVGFNYPNRPDAQVLTDINLTLEPGQFVAVCGPSGSGKSTILQLLQRFYDPGQGCVLVDDVDVRSMNVRWLRANIGLVSQQPTFFASSIRENIAYGSRSDGVPSTHVIESVCKQAHASGFISQFPETFDTQIGERGALLSGGQKQRVAIARALIRRPRIMLLDEATSALDSENERIVREAIEAARKGRTCLMIAHRLSTIQHAHKIVVINDGRIVECGTHEELMQKRGPYFNMRTVSTSNNKQ